MQQTVIDGKDGKNFANRKYYKARFTGDLSYADFRGATCIECTFGEDVDLTGANFTDANCWGSVFDGCKLYKALFVHTNLCKTKVNPRDMRGITITLSCNTFEEMDLGDKFLSYWLYFPTLMKISEHRKAQLAEIMGQDRFRRLDAVMRNTDI